MTGSLVANPPVNSLSDFFVITKVGASTNGVFSISFGEVLVVDSTTTVGVAGAATASVDSVAFVETAEEDS